MNIEENKKICQCCKNVLAEEDLSLLGLLKSSIILCSDCFNGIAIFC